MSSTKSNRAARPPGASVIRTTNSRRNKPSRRGGLVGEIELGGEHRPLGSLHFDVIVTGAAWIERGQDGAEAIATLTVAKEVSAIAEASIVAFATLIGMP